MRVLVDSSVWIAYFRGTDDSDRLDRLIDDNLVTTNDLILAELLPPLYLRGLKRLIDLMGEIERIPLAIDWSRIIEMQVTCLRNGINNVGVPDLIIAQNALQHGLQLFTRDEHFSRMSAHIPLGFYP